MNSQNISNSVLLGMSGGVDSTAAAIVLQKQGYQVAGATMILTESMRQASNEAKALCDRLGIKHYELEMEEEFQKEVRSFFSRSYFEGKTPNPCVVCNKRIKFGAFVRKADELGYEYIATGHYCSIKKDENGNHLLMGTEKKDQSYFLCQIDAKVLDRVIFPIGNIDKTQVRELVADRFGESLFENKKESQDICFVENNCYASELACFEDNTLKENGFAKGEFVLTDGTVLGEHDGFVNYTVGQRHGMGLAYSEPLFVVKTVPRTRQVVVGTANELFSKCVKSEAINVLNGFSFSKAVREKTIYAKVRFGKTLTKLTKLTKNEDGTCDYEFEEPIRAMTPGQYVVLYANGECLGGARILDTN